MLETLRAALTPNVESVRRAPEGWERASEHPYAHHSEAAAAAEHHRDTGSHERAEALLEWCLDFAEAEARAEYFVDVPPAHYEALADLYRDAGRDASAVAVLERYVEFVGGIGGTPRARMVERLEAARERAGQDGDG